MTDQQTDMTAAALDAIEEGLLQFGYSQANQRRAYLAIRSLRKQLDEARAYAESLAVGLWVKHFMADGPNWKPLSGDLIGLLTQIDNMTTGLTAPIQATDAWDRIMEDRTLDRARSKISIRDIQVIVGHVRAALSQEPPASPSPVLRDADTAPAPAISGGECALLREVLTELQWAEKFLTMREKAHPDGVSLYREVMDRVEAALAAADRSAD